MNRIIPLKSSKILAQDIVMKELMSHPIAGYNKSENGVFVDLTRSIIGQQISIAAARTIYNRLLVKLGTNLYLPNQILTLTEDELVQCGISRQKRRYVVNVADYFMQNSKVVECFENMSDMEIIRELTTIKGVGEWTAQMILMFTYRRPDIFPVKDLGIQNAIKKFYDIDLDGKELVSEMENIAQKWQPYRTYACLVLWNALSIKT